MKILITVILVSIPLLSYAQQSALMSSDQEFRSNAIYVSVWSANFRSDNSTESDIIKALHKGDKIFVHEKSGEWYHGGINNPKFRGDKYRSKEALQNSYLHGWIHESVISETYVRAITQLEIRRRDFVNANPDISEQLKVDILSGSIRIGMTKEMVRAAMGSPSDINRTVTASRISEQWVYGTTRNRFYVYIENGIMTSFQD
ncbi:MAG: hypothetical protein WD267_10195 [Balneolales bacterium]